MTFPQMTKREFLKALGGLAMTPLAGAAVGGQPKPRKHFVWMRPSLTKTPDEWQREFAMMRESGITGVIPEIYNGRQAFFQSQRLPVRAKGAGKSRHRRRTVVAVLHVRLAAPDHFHRRR